MPRLDEGPGGGPIQYPTILQTLGTDYQANWTGTTQDALKTVKFTYASASTFGDIPVARDFASVYLAAQHIYEATLRGIKDDVTAAAEALARAASEIRDRDEASADAFQTLQARWGDGGGSSTTRETEQATGDEPVRQGAEAQVRLRDGDGAPPAPGVTTGDATTPAGSGPGGTPSTPAGTPSTPAGSTDTPPSSGMDAG